MADFLKSNAEPNNLTYQNNISISF